tara:strand:+ start:159 stop:491 length:333 start_codon:yes stop_codon:yes gene_type:complete
MAKMKSYEKGSVGAKGIEKALQMAIEDMPEDYDPDAIYDRDSNVIDDEYNRKQRMRLLKEKSKREKRADGSPKSGEQAARMNATKGQAGSGQVSRGGGAALSGIKFKGVF